MKNKLSWLVGSMLMSCALSAQANVIVTPFIGFTGGGQVEDENKNTYDIDPALSYALSIETPFEMGKIGLFYSAQPTELKELSNSADIHYLQLQSSIYYHLAEGWQSYVGLGVGGSYTDVDWADKKYGFSASAFAGLEYAFSKNFALTAQVRWLGTVVDNDTSGACTLPSDGSSCIIKFDTDWMNQFQSNIGFSFRF
ncbi:TPA: outer membrane beta-barrel protein [Vibrio parahaemolyticus]|nr:outer membrane beta-barrel protein [Vibrio parahaemolyticus]HCH2678756.1 outer membrane beta-barrel protein [Vibrio parahaemolyticus]HCH2689339.1 outer membrane beta-barrel protein [Vibrio parahaemolyticus]HCH4200186.1 outer membrane beta-barrel protein [Vibrio parahaemolyticus]HCH4329743.1 outer membrane beta-barrel protein [Vibrio parahaemolyticus]